MLSTKPAESLYEKRTVFRRRIDYNGTWEIQLGIENDKNIPSFVIIAFMEIDKLDSQRHDSSLFDWLPVLSAVCRLGDETNPENFMKFDFSRNNFHKGYYEIENVFLKHTEDIILKPFIDIISIRRN